MSGTINIAKIRLQKEWDSIYQKKKISKNLSSFNNKNHMFFNRLMKEWLFSCQEKNLIPSDEQLDKELPAIFDRAKKKAMFSGIDDDRSDYALIDIALRDIMFLPMKKVGRERNSDEDIFFLEVHGLISASSLTDNEISKMNSIFVTRYDESSDVYDLIMMSVPIMNKITNEKQERINQYCLRVARDRLSKELAKEGVVTEFSYPLITKIKDYFLDRSI